MLKKIILSATALATLAVPAMADAQRYRGGYGHGYNHGGYYNRGYYGRGYYPRSSVNVVIGTGGYYPGYYGYAPAYYGPAYYSPAYYGGGYYGGGGYAYRGGYDRGYYDRCGDGTTGAIVGGAAGALLGRSIDRHDGRGYYRGRHDSGTGGAIIGGVIGALAGSEIDRAC